MSDSSLRPSSGRRVVGSIAAAATLALGLSAISVIPAHAAEVTHVIADVQGTGASTPIPGTVVTIEAIVTADFRNATGSGFRGFYVQTAGSDVDTTPGASDGLFVFAGNANPAVAIGDLVRITGPVSEFGATTGNPGQTQITANTDAAWELVTPGVGVPAATVLPDSVVGEAREAFEGMLVVPENAYLSSTHQNFSFGSPWLSTGALPVKATETTDAGDAANAIAAANRASRLVLDDGYSVRADNAAHTFEPPYLTADAVVRNGDRFVSPAAGMVLGWGFDDYRLQPQVPLSSGSPAEYAGYLPTWETLNPRTDAPEDVGGDISVAAFNVFNYFTTFGGDARGAADPAEFAVQQSKIVAAITALGADVVALQEIENSVKLGEPADEALADLVGALNAAEGSDVWDFVPTPLALQDAAITDFITNAIIYKPASVTPVGESFTDVDETVWDIAREPIAQTFESGDKTFTVVANHFKSKSRPSGSTDPEPSDLQGFFNAERVEQATKLMTFVGGIQSDASKGENVILLGDFNSYHQEDPAQVITGAGFVDLAPTTGEFTYTFDGELGSLDHAFVSPSLADDVTGVDVWTINAPEWGDRSYEFGAAEAGTPFRSSDHDPITLGLSTAADPVTIDLVTINDFHGHLLAAAPDPGAAVLAGAVDAIRAQNPNTLFAAAGDLIGGSPFVSAAQDDEPTIEALNAMGLDVSSFGNHEFDQGRADVDDRVLPLADYDYIAANLFDTTTGEPAFDQYALQEIDGVTVGFIGAVTEDLESLVNPDLISTLEIRDIATEVNIVADDLSDGDPANGEADVIVLLVHEGPASVDPASASDPSTKFGEIVTGVNANVDMIHGAHTHLPFVHNLPVPGGEGTRPVTSAGEYGQNFVRTTMSVDPTTGELISISSGLVQPAGAAPNAEVAAIVAAAQQVAIEVGSVKVGEITADLNRGKTAANADNRGAESPLGNFVADVQLWAVEPTGAEIAFMNPGGLRQDLKYDAVASTPGDGQGVVTVGEAAGVQPFANTLMTIDLTGAEIKSVLEQQWQPAGAARPFLKLGISEGFTYTYDPAAPQGSRITGMWLNGEALDLGSTYKVVANSFLAAGGDNFTAFRDGENKADSGQVDLDAMIRYFEEVVGDDAVSPDYVQRSIGATLSAADADGYSPGDSVTATLEAVVFTAGGPRENTTVEIRSGDTALGSASIDPTIVDPLVTGGVVVNDGDETGRATVAFTIPEGTPGGTLLLTVVVPETGTSITLPLEVVSNEEPIENVTAPKISGQGKVGRTLTASGGTWSVASPTLAFQWNRDGVPIEGATASKYTLVAADAGTAITVTVTATAAGYADGSATSAAKTVAKGDSDTSVRLSHLLVSSNGTVTAKVEVDGQYGIEPVGTVNVYDGRTLVATATLEAGDDGRVTITLPKLGRGIHLVTVRFEGSGQLERSTSFPRILLVW